MCRIFHVVNIRLFFVRLLSLVSCCHQVKLIEFPYWKRWFCCCLCKWWCRCTGKMCFSESVFVMGWSFDKRLYNSFVSLLSLQYILVHFQFFTHLSFLKCGSGEGRECEIARIVLMTPAPALLSLSREALYRWEDGELWIKQFAVVFLFLLISDLAGDHLYSISLFPKIEGPVSEQNPDT